MKSSERLAMLQLPPYYQTWLSVLEKQFASPPLVPRIPLWLGTEPVGSIEERVADLLLRAEVLTLSARGVEVDQKDPDEHLAQIAAFLHKSKLTNRWQDELLPLIGASSNQTLAVVERAAVRPLGIKTIAVHLLACTSQGDIWLQRRSEHKQFDPGKLDLLVGGLVGAGESLLQALKRETWEEAGLKLPASPLFKRLGQHEVRQPIDEHIGGYMLEQEHWYEYDVDEHFTPENQDGEVSDFMLLSPQELLSKMLAGEVSETACLIFAKWFSSCSLPIV